MSAAHTPAPWVIEDGDWLQSERGSIVGGRYFSICITTVCEADRALLIAAPDMLATLEAIDLARHTDAPADWQRATDLSDAAIAKAFGRTPNEIGDEG